MGHGMHFSFGLPNNLGQSSNSSMDQRSPSSFAMGSLYNAYSRPFEDDQ